MRGIKKETKYSFFIQSFTGQFLSRILSAFELNRNERAVLEDSRRFFINVISTDLYIIIICSNSLKSCMNWTYFVIRSDVRRLWRLSEYHLKLTFVCRWYWRCKSMKSLLTVYSPSFLKLDLHFSFNILKSLKSLSRDRQWSNSNRDILFRGMYVRSADPGLYETCFGHLTVISNHPS